MRLHNLTKNFVVAGLLAASVSGYAVVTDPSFELNPLDTVHNVLNNWTPNVWAAESGAIVGPTGPVTPAGGNKMLQMNKIGGVVTQTFQLVDVSAFSSLINSGNGQVVFGALFNVFPNAAGAVGNVGVYTFSGSNQWGSHTAYMSSQVTLNGDPADWQAAVLTWTLPVNTTWLVFELSYTNATLPDGGFGFVDLVRAAVVPEPASLLALGAGIAALAARRTARRA